MKKLFFTLILFSTTFYLSAQTDTTYWQIGGGSTLTFSQVSLTNWAAGGQNSAAINFNYGMFADHNKGRTKWENSLDIGYGLIKQGNSGFAKSDDKLNIVTKYGYQIKKGNAKWFFSALLDFKTQFYDGFDPEDNVTLISDFMAPGYLVIGTGVDYYPNEFLSFSYIPLTGKFTFVQVQELADNGDYGVDPAVRDDGTGNIITPGKNSRAELGSFFRAKYKKKTFESRLELFTNYVEDFGTIDVNWQNALVVNLTKVLSTNFFTQLIYDDDIKIGADDNDNGVIEDSEFKSRVQFKSVIGIGLTYQFGATKE
ncbi:MAG: DUF3078 domain-containing protein [Cyclobacteriaceae bacterium]